MYEGLIKRLLFQMDAENAHHLTARWLGSPLLGPFFPKNPLPKGIERDVFSADLCGIPLENPIGLAAGFDKDAKLLPHLHRFGFGFVEIGTVTAKAQVGNPKPRLFRLPEDQALINRMGFNNDGADAAAERLKGYSARFPVGGNIGKSKVTPLEKAHEDYAYSLKALTPYVDYFVVNVSSPNTPNLRKLQAKEPLAELLRFLKSEDDSGKPLLLKIAPDLTDTALEDIVEVAETCGVEGVIATNTTISREGLKSGKQLLDSMGAGGLSGYPLKSRSLEVLSFLRKNLPANIRLVGVGGIFSGKDVFERIYAGADCVQIYTGLVYRGPKTVALLMKELYAELKKNGFNAVKEAVGKGVVS